MEEIRRDIEHHTFVIHRVGFLFSGGSFLLLYFLAVEKENNLYERIYKHKKVFNRIIGIIGVDTFWKILKFY